MINGKPTISETTFDVIIIGAGINGAGIARDAAMRGLKVLLLDKGDIGGGTSAWSTRLIHGGLRYLEYGELGLVRESLRERECLMRIAPHLVRPLPLLVPIYDAARRGPWTIRAGMVAYDLMSFDKKLPRHRMLSRDEALEEAAGLERAGLVGASLYYDAQVEFAERLVLENVLSAVEHGALVQTYARVNRFIFEAGVVVGVELFHELTGEKDVARSRLLINAAGPWVDGVLRNGGQAAGSERLIGGTKGSHIVVARFQGAPATALYVEAQTDRRPFFIIPWNEKLLIGTTDFRYDGDLDDVEITADEIEYLLSESNRILPEAKLGHGDILYSYSGVRPLPFVGEKEARSITRRHFIESHPEWENVLSIVGGKLTTYRSLAEETVDLIFRKLGKDSPPCATGEVSLPGAGNPNSPKFLETISNSHFSIWTGQHLWRTYGEASANVSELIQEDARLGQVIDEETGAVAAEVVYAFREEFAQTLTDCLMRRTMIGFNSMRGLNAIGGVADIAQDFLGWSEAKAVREVEAYRAYVEKHLVLASRAKS